MSRTEQPMAIAAKPKMIVRKQFPSQAPLHQIESVTRIDADNYRIKTNSGEWIFEASEPVVFPRRDDGSVVNWCDAEVPPTGRKLYVGDILPSPDPHPSTQIQGYEEYPPEIAERFEALWRRDAQTITAITAHPQIPGLLQVTTRQYTSSNFDFYPIARWNVNVDDTLEFPRTTIPNRKKKPIASFEDLQLEGRGFYVWKDCPSDLVMFVHHPNGRGRWPTELMNGDWWLDLTAKNRLIFLRPPGAKTKHNWKDFHFVGKEHTTRFPTDPRHRVAHNDFYDQGWAWLVNLAQKAYDAYSDKYATRYEVPDKS